LHADGLPHHKKWLRQNKVHAIDMNAHASAHHGAPPLSPQVHAIDMDGDGKISAAELNQRVGVHEQFGVTAGTMRTLSP
jgi:hypothetical protein